MSATLNTNNQLQTFDLFRLTKAKQAVDLSPNTVRRLAKESGLRIYRHGKIAFVSKSELAQIIRTRTQVNGVAD